MAALTTLAAVAALGVGTASYISAERSRKEAQANYQAQAAEQTKARSEQAALNAQQAAQERRQQIREERVRRSKLLQAAEATGTEGSSGEAGAVGGFSSQLGANLGANLGMIAGAGRISAYNQTAADFGTAAARNLSNMGAAQNLFQLSTTIFSAAGGFSAFSSPKAAPVG